MAMKQRSFRLEADTLRRLDASAEQSGESGNSRAQRLIEEGLRRESHPQIYFRDGAAGRRPALAGSRLDVAHVIDTVRAHEGSIELTAAYFEVPEARVQACVSYYAEFQAEVDAWAERMRAISHGEQEAARREQEVLG